MTLMAKIGIILSCEVMYIHRVMQITMLLAMGITTQVVGSVRLTYITGPIERKTF